MGPIQKSACSAFLLATVGNAQSTQIFAFWPWLCVYPDSDPETGTVWARIDACKYETAFYLSAPDVLGSTITSGDGLCLDANVGEVGVVFRDCDGSAAQQRWKFKQHSGAAERLGHTAVPGSGQVMLADPAGGLLADSNMWCLEMPWRMNDQHTFFEPLLGEKVYIKECELGGTVRQEWAFPNLPPADKTLLVMPALIDQGKDACVAVATVGNWAIATQVSLASCEENTLARNFWLREGEFIHPATDISACVRAVCEDCDHDWMGWDSYLHIADCDDAWLAGDHTEPKNWTFDESSGALKVANPADDDHACITYVNEEYGEFALRRCTGSSDQVFAWGMPAAPVSAAYGLEVV